ncbi:MAG: flippase-like domain-containing protein [Thalassotalea sp.]|nr:flippase-like domain-containing protein [Thalassotalea sp.]
MMKRTIFLSLTSPYRIFINTLTNYFLKSIQLLIALGLLSLLVSQTGLLTEDGRSQLYQTFVNANPLLLLLSLLIAIVINMASSLKWWMLVQSQDVEVGYWRIFCYYLVGQFYNQVLPTSVGGDVVRSFELGRYTGNQAQALASVFVERFTGILVLLLVAAFAVLMQLSRFNTAYIWISLVVFSVGLALLAWLVTDLRAYEFFKGVVVRRLAISETVFSKLDRLLISISSYRDSNSVIALALLNSVFFYFLAVVNVFITALVFDQQVVFLDMLIATPIIMLLMNLPISLGNLFLMEAAYTGIFALMGYSPALGLSVAITMRLKSLIDGLLGGLLHPFFVTKRHQ